MFCHALTRRPGPDLVAGLTSANLGAPDLALALAQHESYVQVLRGMGLAVEVLPALNGHPDACFVEDTAVIVPELAVITRPGAPTRRGETDSIAVALAAHRPLVCIDAPGTLDGGDVLVAGRTCWIGLSARTNEAGAGQLATLLEGCGYACFLVPVGAGLHLKSSVNHLGDRRLLMTGHFAGLDCFADWDRIIVPAGEEYACNTLWINGNLLVPDHHPATAAKLDELGLPLIALDTSEIKKLDGGLTCLSLRF